MAQQFATGAVHVFIRFGGQGAIQYFGTTESMPQDSRSPEYETLMNDVSGSKVPLDLAWEAESAQISLVMTRWDENVAQAIEVGPGLTANLGSWSWNDVGTLMGLEGEYTELWLTYQFGSILGNKAAYVGQGLKPGRHYVQSVLWAPQQDETGTKPMKRHFMFFAWPKINATTKRFTLWDYDFTGITANLIT